MQHLITSSYEHKLGAAYHRIDNRGILLNTNKLVNIRKQVEIDLNDLCASLSTTWGFPVYIGTGNKISHSNALNLNSPSTVLERLTNLGYKVPKIRKKDKETDEYTMEESVNELALRTLYSDPSLWPNSNAGEAIKKVLGGRELITFRNRYINAKLYKDQYFCNYNVAGSVTGRRGSKKNIFGFGGNAQNFPARGKLSDLWKECIIPRPGKIFFLVDQMQAEDWPVQALAENYTALTDMLNGVNRHYKFASAIFNRSIDDLKRGRKCLDDLNFHQQCEMEYSLGKRGRHANNYGMQAKRLSEILAGEGYSVPPSMCKMILETINRIDPNVKQVFHNYIQEQLFNSRKLQTPLGRERQFFGLRQNDKNYSLLNEAYSYIPQSTVGDNTGLAILYLDGVNIYVIQESHDSICQEIPDTEHDLIETFHQTKNAFNRDIIFHNGIKVNIPIEGKLGLSWKDTVSIESFTEEGVVDAYRKLKELREQLSNKAASLNN